jgi:F-type H+-transporting ATPase subunit delta
MSDSQASHSSAGQVADEERSMIARVYAEGLMNAADAAGEADAVLDEIEEIDRDIFQPNPGLAELFGSPQVSEFERKRILQDIFDNRASDLVRRFLQVLNRHGRLQLFSAVAHEARGIWNKRRNRVPVQVRSAVPLDDSQRAALAEKVGRMLAATPILDVSTDPSLIGGLVLRVGDYVYDSSVKNRLEQLRQRLIEGKTHEIQSRRDQFSYPA